MVLIRQTIVQYRLIAFQTVKKTERTMNKNIDDKNDDDIIEDTVFFYPIIGIIRNNLIENLYDKESISEIHEEGNK